MSGISAILTNPLLSNILFIACLAIFIVTVFVMSYYLPNLDDSKELKQKLTQIIVPTIVGSFVLFIALYLYFQQMTSNVVLINVILIFTCLSIIMSISAIGALALID